MKKQNYSNHRMYYPLHHFIFLPVMTAMVIYGIVHIYQDAPNKLVWKLFSLLSFSILLLSVILRQHYALGNQNRIIRLEFRLRYFELFGKSSSDIEPQLRFSQIAALRFAPDDEFKVLLDRAINEHIGGNKIKKAIGDWQGDYSRV